ncbi:MAG TPA: SCO family protein [Verrucomicrobiae bacterium]|nr:SCO family protein [Verrucomicrobiae bacterium]
MNQSAKHARSSVRDTPKRGRALDERIFLGTVVFSAVAILAVIILANVRKRRAEPLREYRQVAAFQLTERSGRVVSREELNGKIVVVNFFFGACSAQCQVLSQRMAEVQRLTADMDDVLLVSITVDPRSDTPEALTRYANRINASTNRWLFLTGEKKVIYPLIQDSFLQPVAKASDLPSAFNSGFIHSEKIALVDRHVVVRAYYEGMEAQATQKIMQGIHRLRME